MTFENALCIHETERARQKEFYGSLRCYAVVKIRQRDYISIKAGTSRKLPRSSFSMSERLCRCAKSFLRKSGLCVGFEKEIVVLGKRQSLSKDKS